jgi:hypothetical protein
LAEVLAATQVHGRIDHRLLAKVGVSAWRVVKVRRATSGVATIAVAGSVDQIASKSHQNSVSAIEIQGDGRYFETDSNSGVSVVIVRVSAGWLD